MFAAAGFAVMTALVKLAGTGLHVTQILFLRQLGMLVFTLPFILNNIHTALKTQRLHLQLLRLVFALIAMLGGFSAVIHMPLADATAIAFAKSFFVTIFAVLLLKEQVGRYRWLAVIVGFIGVLVMLRPGTESFTIYSIYALVGAAAAGIVMVIIRLMSRTDAPETILLYQALGIAIAMCVPAIYYWQWPTPYEWFICALIGAVSYFAQKANIYAYKFGEASLLASLDYVRLLYATLFGYLLFDQLPGVYTWLGAFIIICASIFTVHREAKRKQQLARSPYGRSFTNH